MPLVLPWSRQICPHCFERFRFAMAPFQCQNTDVRVCPAERDEVYGRFLGRVSGGKLDIPLRGKTIERSDGSFMSSFYTPAAVRCPNANCRRVTQTRICPECHSELPTAHGNVKNQIIAVVGARASGKSNFIGVLITQLLRRYGPGLRFTVRSLGDSTSDRYDRLYFDPIYRQGAVVEPSQRVETNPDLRIPLVYRLEFWDRRPVRGINMVLFDTAGEDMQSQQVLAAQYRYICSASAIIFLVNPLNFGSVLSQLPEDMPDGMVTEGADPAEIVDRVYNLFHMPIGRRIRVPAVFAFTKSDMLRNVVDASAMFLQDSDHEVRFDRRGFVEVDQEIRDHLDSWGQRDLLSKVSLYFKRSAFTAVSAFGDAPTQENRIRGVPSPIRVGDPLLWILWQLGYIRG